MLRDHMNKRQEELLYDLCISFIEMADDALLLKLIDCDTYNELTRLKRYFIKDFKGQALNSH